MVEEGIPLSEFKKFVIQKYSQFSNDKDERIMNSIIDLIIFINQKRNWNKTIMDSLLEKVATIFQRELKFKEVTIGLKDKSDGKFRYRIVKGHSPDATAAHWSLEYSEEDMFDDDKYPAIKFGRNIVELTTVEDPGQDDWITFTSPSLIQAPRPSIDILKEGDYFHAFLFGSRKELIGFLEFTAWEKNKLPPSKTIKWAELLCTVVGNIIWEKEYAPNQKTKLISFSIW